MTFHGFSIVFFPWLLMDLIFFSDFSMMFDCFSVIFDCFSMVSIAFSMMFWPKPIPNRRTTRPIILKRPQPPPTIPIHFYNKFSKLKKSKTTPRCQPFGLGRKKRVPSRATHAHGRVGSSRGRRAKRLSSVINLPVARRSRCWRTEWKINRIAVFVDLSEGNHCSPCHF